MAGINITLGGNFAALNQLRTRVQSTAKEIRRAFAERIGHRALDGLLMTASRMPAVIGKAVDAASDFEETASKIGVIFKENSDSVMDWGKTAAGALGQSRNAALGAAADIGNLFNAMGMTADRSAEMSTGLVELAADLASFNNTSPEDAVTALGAALRGESEPIRRYGVLLDDATLKAQAMAMGIYDGKGALAPATRALAAYEAILKQTSAAQGDFARTADGYANSQRIAAAEIEDATQKLGEELMPVVQSMARDLQNVDFGLLAEQLAEVLTSAAGLASVIPFVGDAFAALGNGKAAKFFEETNAAVREFNFQKVRDEVASTDEVVAKLKEIDDAREELFEKSQAAILPSTDPVMSQQIVDTYWATVKVLDVQAEKLRNISAEQLAANQAVRDAADAEAARAARVKESMSAYEKAKGAFDKTLAGFQSDDRERMSLDDKIEALGKAEEKLRETFKGTALEGLRPEDIAKELHDAVEAGRTNAGYGEAMEAAAALLEIERERAKLATDEAEKRKQAADEYKAQMAEIKASASDIADEARAVASGKEDELKISRRARELEKSGVGAEDADAIARNEGDLEKLRELTAKQQQGVGTTVTAASGLQRIGGGDGAAGTGLDYARQGVELQRSMAEILARIEQRLPGILD